MEEPMPESTPPPNPRLNYRSASHLRPISHANMWRRSVLVLLAWVLAVSATWAALPDQLVDLVILLFFIALETVILGGLLLFLLLAPPYLERSMRRRVRHVYEALARYYSADVHHRQIDAAAIPGNRRGLLNAWTASWAKVGFRHLADIAFPLPPNFSREDLVVYRALCRAAADPLVLVCANPPIIPGPWAWGSGIVQVEERLSLVTTLSDGTMLVTECPPLPSGEVLSRCMVSKSVWPNKVGTLLEEHQARVTDRLATLPDLRVTPLVECGTVIALLDALTREFFARKRDRGFLTEDDAHALFGADSRHGREQLAALLREMREEGPATASSPAIGPA
jgi:hypothetical protein